MLFVSSIYMCHLLHLRTFVRLLRCAQENHRTAGEMFGAVHMSAAFDFTNVPKRPQATPERPDVTGRAQQKPGNPRRP